MAAVAATCCVRIAWWTSLPALALGVVLAGAPSCAWTQDDIEDLIGETRSGPAAEKLLAQANAEAPATGDRQDLAIFHHRRGRARFQLGDYSRAADDLRLALKLHQPGGKVVEGFGVLYRIEIELGNSLSAQGRWFEAIDHWKDVARRTQSVSPPNYMFAYHNLSGAYAQIRAYAEAEAALKIADGVLPGLQALPEWGVWQFNWPQHAAAYRARLLHTQGRHAEAEPFWRTALGLAEKDVALKLGRFGATHQDTVGALQNRGNVQRGLADNLATQGKYGDAEILARQALRGQLDLYAFNSVGVSAALATLAWTRAQQGDFPGSEKYYRHALAAVEGARVAPHSTALAARRASLGYLLVLQSRWEEANAMFELRAAGLRSDPEQLKRVGVGWAAWVLALVNSGRVEQSVQQARSLVEGQQKRTGPNPWEIAMHRGLLGMTLVASGQDGEALQLFRESVPELMRGEPTDDRAESGYRRGFWRRVILEGYLELLAKLHQTGAAPAGLDVVDESFRVADMARASLVQEAITAAAARARLPDRNLADLARLEQDAANRLAALNRILSRLAASGDDQRVSKIISDIRSEMEQLRKEQAARRADIRQRFPDYAELTEPRPVGLRETSKALGTGEALVSVYLGPSRSYVWTAGPDRVSSFRVVQIKRDEVEAEVRELRNAVDLGDGNALRLRPFDLARAHKLYRVFFEADEALWREAQVLNVIPHGALGQLPVALLVTAVPPAGGEAAYREAPWLIRKVAIAQLPSATALTALRRAPAGWAQRQPFIGFGDPLFTPDPGARAPGSAVRNLTVRKIADYTEEQVRVAMSSSRTGEQGTAAAMPALSRAFALLGTLPDTSEELREIASVLKADPSRDIFVGRQATEKNVKQSALQNHRVVAFATHGIAPGEITGLDQPALVLSNPALTGDTDNDGFLTMEEVLALKLDADWVVLSACNTASADGRGSEAVSGLGRAFFYAGARSLLVSNWAVETTSARLLTTELFRRQAGNPQLTRAEALRQSMLDLMGKKSPTGFSYAHPAFWAPFSLVGDGGR